MIAMLIGCIQSIQQLVVTILSSSIRSVMAFELREHVRTYNLRARDGERRADPSASVVRRNIARAFFLTLVKFRLHVPAFSASLSRRAVCSAPQLGPTRTLPRR